MNRNRAVLLAVIQIALVLSIAGKYLYERKTCPRVWVRTAQFDPNMPLRGRYLTLQLSVNGCDLPKPQEPPIAGLAISGPDFNIKLPPQEFHELTVRAIVRGGKLVPVVATKHDRPEDTQRLTLWRNRGCDRATLGTPVDYYIPDTARTPFPLKPGQELWVEVTVPPMGPPRPIQLAVSENGAFTPLKLD